MLSSLIRDRSQQIQLAKEVISTVPNAYPVKDLEKAIKLVKFMAIDTLIYADKIKDLDTPTSEERRLARESMIKKASEVIADNKRQIADIGKLSYESKHQISESTFICADIYGALTATSNDTRRKIYNEHWNEQIFRATHNTLTFQGILEEGKEPEIIMVDYYDNVINNDKNYEAYVNAEDISEKRKILSDNIEISSIYIVDIQKSEHGESCGIEGALMCEPLPKRVYEIAEGKLI